MSKVIKINTIIQCAAYRMNRSRKQKRGSPGIKQYKVVEGDNQIMWIRLLYWGNYVMCLGRTKDKYWNKNSSFEVPFFVMIFVGILLDYW